MARRRPRWAWLFFPQVAALVTASLLATARRLPVATLSRHGLDKLGHLLGFGGVAFLAVGFFGEERWRGTVLAVATLSALEEASQRFLPARTLDPWDLAANVVGIVAFGILAARLQTRSARASG
jgi:VanZ family protein